MESKEVVLSGGAMNRVVKREGVVHRAVKGHPMLHEYLLYLERAGMPGVPRFLGLDDSGRERLTYLPGKTMGPDYPHNHPCLHSDQALADMARFMRKLHDVSAGFLPAALTGGWRNPDFPDGPYETICHGDAAIWNFAFVDDRLAGLFDFDQACPGARAWDLTSTVFSAVGLTHFADGPEPGTSVAYAPSLHAADRKRRIALFFDAYGMQCPDSFWDLLVGRMQGICDEMEQGAANGEETFLRMVKGGGLLHYQRVVGHLKAHSHEWR